MPEWHTAEKIKLKMEDSIEADWKVKINFNEKTTNAFELMKKN